MTEKKENNNKTGTKEENITIPKQEYDALKLKADERDGFYDKYVRAHAEFENAKKRMEKEKIDFLKYANDGQLAGMI